MNSVSDRFNELAAGVIRPLDWELSISWTKHRNSEVDWFTLDQSALDGVDLLAEDLNNAVQLWDAYDYTRFRDRVIDMNLERSVEFPYNIQSAVLDVTLNNYDGYFSVNNSESPLAEYIRPSRPIRAYLGFQGGGVTPVFVGLTEQVPEYSGTHDTTASLSALDFLATIGDLSLTTMVMMRDVRTDEVIATILQQFGMTEQMYNLDPGVNTIPFVYFDSGKDAGNALKELVQAENGAMWIDEQGIIRFAPRTFIIGLEPVMTIGLADIVEITPSQTDDIVNRVYIEADIRAVADYQAIFTVDNSNGYNSESADDDSYRVAAGGSAEIWISFDDPIWAANLDAVLNGDETDSNFTAVNLSGEFVSSGVEVYTSDLFAETAKLTFRNTNNFAISIYSMSIWGEPAKVLGTSPTITYIAEDEDSVEQFGTQELEITDNTCFGSQANIDAFATDVLEKRAGFNPTLSLQVKGNPALQLHDIITLEGTENFDGTWLIEGISHSLSSSGLTTTLSVVRQELVSPFTLDVSQLDGADVLS